MNKEISIWKIQVNRRMITYASYAFFVLLRIFLIIRYEGWYAFDETYHISSSNDTFYLSSRYVRSAGINTVIHWLSGTIGKSYYVYKLIPFVLSVISVGALFYVLYHLASHTYSIVIFAFIICFHGVIIYNHLYIREYIYDEAVVSGLVFLFYQMYKAQTMYKRIGLYIAYIALAVYLAVLQFGYPVALILAVFGIWALIVNEVLKNHLQQLKKSRYVIPAAVVLILMLIVFEIMIVGYRIGAISLPLPAYVSVQLNQYGNYWGHPYFTRNFYREGIGLVLGVIAYGYYLVKHVDDYANNVIGIYCLGVTPFIVFNMAWFDCFPMRVYASYLPVFILIAVLGFDTFPRRIPYRCLIAVFSILVVLKPETEIDIVEYIRVPYIWNETNFNDYDGLIGETQKAINDGRRCICIWSDEHEEAAFEIDAEYTIALSDEINILNGYTEEDLHALLQYLQDTREAYVLMIGTHCDWVLDDITEDFLDTLFENYPYSEYERRAYLFYIN